jgi:MEDS: MEthanogen/methylotroph, DcmR Sensory domain
MLQRKDFEPKQATVQGSVYGNLTFFAYATCVNDPPTHPLDGPLAPAIFWGEIAPSEHIAQFYEDDAVFLDTLLRFVDAGLMAGEAVIVIATRQHLRALEERLSAFTIGMATNRLTGAYITIDAHEALGKFMIKGWPDDGLFLEFVMGLIERATANGRRVRAFGEMVALLWAAGNTAATIRLEYLWNKVCKIQKLPLFCAYPKTGFTEETSKSIAEICAAHSKII